MMTTAVSTSGALTAATALTAEPVRQNKPRRERLTAGLVTATVLVWIYAATLFLPIYYIFISAFKTNTEMFVLPWVPTFSEGVTHFIKAFERLELEKAMLNSVYITGAALVLTTVLAVPASYALARATGRVAALVERIYALGFLIPGFAALVPTLLLAIQLDLYHTREFMWLYFAAAAQPLTVILLTQFMRTVPAELEESATIDGAGRLKILWYVYLPLTVGGIATTLILNFLSFWNDYLFTLILVGFEPDKRTLQVAIPQLSTNLGYVDNALIAAGSVISIVPVFIVYAILNRRLENALVQGAVKG